ncbi:CGNR zinc finger domain-containing protein [Rhodospirillaceae bacterium KN72]|uniref:CGNR zinc finger domain-containing protein n=1 Tax=Pacificispira spongiicola TaxID=2729598 RepID=A0A7Y0HIJ4_9PROT|nr:CGNR zinc finger domain-containing protein [Pacificispira spongiicola]NMM46614.1 CGNR zinc finger domain-containing protein [Pacificispira spongiicola]
MTQSSSNGLAEALLKTYEVALAEPEHLNDPGDLDAFADRHGLTTRPADENQLASTKRFRDSLRRLFDASTPDPVRLSALNQMLDGISVGVELIPVSEERFCLTLKATSDDTAFTVIRDACLIDVVNAAERYGLNRLKSCLAEPCRDAFVDMSKNGSRRFCSTRCANRWHVSQHRARRQNN